MYRLRFAAALVLSICDDSFIHIFPAFLCFCGRRSRVREGREAVRPLKPDGESRGAKSLRPDLRMANSEGGRTSYWQGPEQTRQRTARTVFRALRGSPTFCVSHSKARPQVIWPHGIRRPVPKAGPPPSLPGPSSTKSPFTKVGRES